MMHCGEAEELISALVDGELALAEMERIHHHLDKCSDCRARREMEDRLKSYFRERLAAVNVPADLKQKIQGALASLPADPSGPPEAQSPSSSPGPRPALWRRFRGPGAFLVAVGCAMIVTMLVLERPGPRGPGGSPVGVEMAGVYRAATGAGILQVRDPNPQRLEAWLHEALGHAVAVPDFAAHQLTPSGARIIRIGGHQAGLVMYGNSQGDVSPVMLLLGLKQHHVAGFSDTGERLLGDPLYAEQIQEVALAAYGHEGCYWTLASQDGQARLLELARFQMASLR